MIGYKKAAFEGKNSVQTARFSGFSLYAEKAGRLTGVESLNCDCHGGKLRRGVGFILYEEEPLFAFLDSDGLGAYPISTNLGVWEDSAGGVLVDENGYLCSWDTASGAVESRAFIGSYPTRCGIRVETRALYHLFAGDKAAYWTQDGVDFTHVVTGDIRGACAAGNRFFVGVGGTRVLYTAPFAPTEWSGGLEGGGELYAPSAAGALVGLEGVGEYAYLFGEYGVYRVRASASAMRFEVEPLHYGGGRICPRSCVAIGEEIYFLAEEGIYRLCGREIRRVLTDLPVLPKRGCVCRVGKCGDTALIEYEEESGASKRLAVRAGGETGFFVEAYGNLGGNEHFCSGSIVQRFARDASVGEYGTLPYFESGALRFGRDKQKLLKRLRLFGKGRVQVRIVSDGIEHRYAVDCARGEGVVPLCDKGNSFVFRFVLGEQCELAGMQVEYICLEE